MTFLQVVCQPLRCKMKSHLGIMKSCEDLSPSILYKSICGEASILLYLLNCSRSALGVIIYVIAASGALPECHAQVDRPASNSTSDILDSNLGFMFRNSGLVGVHVPDDGVASLQDVPSPQEIELISTGPSKLLECDVNSFSSRFPNLRSLYIEKLGYNNPITTADYELLLRYPNLRQLRIDYIASLGDSQMRMGHPVQLDTLSVRLGPGVAGAKLLQGLSLKDLQVFAEDSDHFAGLMDAIRSHSRLERLELCISHFSPRQQIDLSSLSELHHLKTLELQNVSVFPEDFGKLKHLDELRLCNCKFLSPGNLLFRHPSLQRIVLEVQLLSDLQINRRVDAVGPKLKEIELRLPCLEELSLLADADCDFAITLGTQSPSAVGCREFALFQNQHILHKFDETSLKFVSGLKRLREVHFSGDEMILGINATEQALTKLVSTTSITALTGAAGKNQSSERLRSTEHTSKLKEMSLILHESMSPQLLSMLVGKSTRSLAIEFYDIPDGTISDKYRIYLPSLESLEIRSFTAGPTIF